MSHGEPQPPCRDVGQKKRKFVAAFVAPQKPPRMPIDLSKLVLDVGEHQMPKGVAAMFAHHDAIFAFDVETHTMVPKAKRLADLRSDTTFSDEFFNQLRVIQIGWAVGKANEDVPVVFEHLVRPNGFEITPDAALKHGIGNRYAEENGRPIADVILDFFEAATVAHRQGAIFTSFNFDFDAGMIRSELKRLKLHEEAEQWGKFIANKADTMDKRIGKWVMSFTTGGDKGFLSLNETAKALVPAKELVLCEDRHQAGADARLHWFLYRNLSQRAARTENCFNN